MNSPGLARPDVLRALSAIARALAETRGLPYLLERVAGLLRPLVPHDGMGVLHFEAADAVQVYAVLGEEPGRPARSIPLGDCSPRLRHESHLGRLDPATDLDPGYAFDREIQARGFRTLLLAPLRREGEAFGALWLLAAEPGAFTAEHGGVVEPVADLLSLAIERERLCGRERERRRRSEALEALLPTLAGALDVRQVFHQLSTVAQAILPHAFLGLGLLNEGRNGVRVYATSDPVPPELPEFLLPAEMRDAHEADFFVLRDVRLEPGTRLASARLYRPGAAEAPRIRLELDPFRHRMIEEKAVRCLLRVPVRLGGQVAGFLIFAARQPEEYGEHEAALARRIADHVALALSHQRLAEEEKRLVEARERARQLETRVSRLTEELERTGAHRALGSSERWREVLAQAAKVAPTETTVLLTGESGTGKEVLARLVHRGSPRAEGPFVGLNCAALPDPLLESEMFGHEKGAFTGATAARAGRIEQAAGGVLFLDEVGEMSPLVQSKLLRMLQEREFQRLGSSRAQKADVRIVAATNRDLEAAIARGEFREDLYYRLHVFEIRLPPLRERPEDILLLADAFLKEIGQAVGRPAAGLSRDARERLLAYPWPGNVRELRNALERAVILCEGGLVTGEHLPIATRRSASPVRVAGFPVGGLRLEAMERELVQRALQEAKNNKSKAARLLGLSRAQLYSRLEKYGLRGEG